MKLRFFVIPMQQGPAAADDLNAFLSTHRVLAVDRHFVTDGSNSSWAVCVSYLDSGARPALEKRGRVDYREVLSDRDFALFARLRALRKTLAERDGVPAYALFTNEQLAEVVRRRATSIAALEQIDGVGPARAAKYGAAVLEIIKAEGPVQVSAQDGRASP